MVLVTLLPLMSFFAGEQKALGQSAEQYAMAFASQTTEPSLLPYQNESLPMEERISDALGRMTLQEKINIIHAQSKFSSPGVPRLGIPGLWTTDGPHGIRAEVLWDEWNQAGWTNDSCTAFPALTCLAATWDPNMAAIYGRALGEEARYRGKDVVLGPGVNIYRTPLNGRNFEYMGEDPLLASRMVVPYIQAMQSLGVASCVKHYALNNNEINRHTTNVILSERALREIYLPAFHAAVTEGGAWSIMGSYNLYKDEHCCHNNIMLNQILKEEWGFDGSVVSDWGGTHNTLEAIKNGLDLEFGSWTNGLTNGASNAYDNYFLANPYRELIVSGQMGTAELDAKVRRVLRLIFRTSMKQNKPFGALGNEAHSQAARTIAGQGIVLLQNKGNVLPMQVTKGKRILVVGENAIKPLTVGGGSSSLKARYEVSPLDGLRRRFGSVAEVLYARGYVGSTQTIQDGLTAGADLTDNRSAKELIREAVAMAEKADYVIFVGGLNKDAHQDCEDSDRKGLELPYGQDAVIEALAAVCPRLVVVNISGNAVAMPWVDKVGSIVQAWYLGSESGNAIADVLSGDVCPSGRLPFSFPKKLTDVGAHALGAYPGTPRTDGSHIVDLTYAEDILVGYRWHDTKKVEPLFAFGHGLSYTQFAYSDLRLSGKNMSQNPSDTLTLTFKITNKGQRAGAEVAQLYIADPKCSVLRPAKELKAFCKVWLEAGQTKEVTLKVSVTDLMFYDEAQHQWRAEAGRFDVLIGASAADIKLKGLVELK